MHPILHTEAATEQTLQVKENRHALRQMARRVSLAAKFMSDRPFEATLQDLSRRGMRLRSETNIPCGETITIEAVENAGLNAVECRIMRVQLVGSEEKPVFEYGVQICLPSREQGHRWFLHFCYGGRTEHPIPMIG